MTTRRRRLAVSHWRGLRRLTLSEWEAERYEREREREYAAYLASLKNTPQIDTGENGDNNDAWCVSREDSPVIALDVALIPGPFVDPEPPKSRLRTLWEFVGLNAWQRDIPGP